MSEPKPHRTSTADRIVRIIVIVGLLFLVMMLVLPAIVIRGHGGINIAEATAQLKGLTANIEMYYVTFSAYPGPMPRTAPTSGNSTCTTGTPGLNKISGTQNLYLGLCFPMNETGSGTRIIGTTTTPTFVDPHSPEGPVDLSTPAPYRQSPPFFSAANREISENNAKVGWSAFPTILDRNADPLPILYYRRAPNNDKLVTSATSTDEAYSMLDNAEYTNARALVSLSGKTFDQTKTPLTPRDFNALLTHPTSGQVMGSYILIAAGPDRSYGLKDGKNDNITSIGGP